MMRDRKAKCIGLDYSKKVIEIAKEKHAPLVGFYNCDYRNIIYKDFNRIVMQGVLEHLDDPFTELKWMMDNLLTERGDVITSSPCFLNPRGIVWMTLNMLGAIMSKTDLYYLNPWEFEEFCIKNKYGLIIKFCDWNWGWKEAMITDLKKRIPLALQDGKIPYKQDKFQNFMDWLERISGQASKSSTWLSGEAFGRGATAVYRIMKGGE